MSKTVGSRGSCSVIGVAATPNFPEPDFCGAKGHMSGYRVKWEIRFWSVMTKMSRPARGAWVETKLV